MTKPKAELFASIIALPEERRATWFDELPKEQQNVAMQVKEYLIEHGGPILPRARNLVAAYELKVSAQTVATWFRNHE